MSNRGLNVYRKMKITDMNQQELIIFLYDSALASIEESRETIKAGNVVGTHEKLDRARQIFIHLISTLNLEAGGEFALKLSALYSFFIEKITVANVTKETRELDDIVPLINEIKEAWMEMKYEQEPGENPGGGNKTDSFISVEA